MLHRVGVVVVVHKAAAVVHMVAVAVHIRAAGHKAAAGHRQAAGHRHYVVDGAGEIAAGSYSKDLEFRSAAEARHSKEELEAEDWPESIFALGTVMGVWIDCYGHEPGQQRPFLLQLARDQKHSYRDLLLGPRNKP